MPAACAAWSADDSGINAGAATEMGFRKNVEAMRMAMANKLPFIHLVESAGANLMKYKVELWAHGGKVFASLAHLARGGAADYDSAAWAIHRRRR